MIIPLRRARPGHDHWRESNRRATIWHAYGGLLVDEVEWRVTNGEAATHRVVLPCGWARGTVIVICCWTVAPVTAWRPPGAISRAMVESPLGICVGGEHEPNRRKEAGMVHGGLS